MRALDVHGLVEIRNEDGEEIDGSPWPVYHWTDDRPEDLARPVACLDFVNGRAVLTVGPAEEPRQEEARPYNLDAEEVEILRGMEDAYREGNGGEL